MRLNQVKPHQHQSTQGTRNVSTTWQRKANLKPLCTSPLHIRMYTRYHNTNWYQVHIPLTSCKTQRNTFLPSVKRSSFSPSLPPSCRASQEAEVFLIWHKALSLLLRQIQFGACPLKIVPHLSNLASSLARFGEDKASEGILGVIGLGKKSTYSCE